MPKALSLALLSLVIAMTQLAHAAVSLDFEGPFAPVKTAPNSRGVVDGEIFPPMAENSSGWANVDMHFSRLTNGAFDGKASQRVEVKAVREGRAQAWVPLESVEPGRYARLRFAARAPSSGALEVQIRLAGAPYTSMWEKRIALSPEWRRFDLTVPAIQYRPDTGYVLMLYFGVGITDLDNLSVEFIDVDKLITDAPRKEGNLLATSSFPIGIPSPWSLGSGPVGAHIATDAATLGSTGVPSLKLTPGAAIFNMPREVSLISPPIQLNQCRPHTISLYLKGSAPKQRVSVQLGGANGPTERRDLTVITDWQRYNATVKLPFVVDGFVFLRVDSDQTFWLDGLQLEESDKASDFRRAAKPDLQLRATKSFGLYLDDDPMRLTYAVVGDIPAGAVISGSLLDSFGRRILIGPLPCEAIKGKSAELTVAPGLYGTYIAELRLVDGAGRPLSDWAEAVLHRIRAPRMPDRDAPESPFGVHIDPIPEYAQMVKTLGFNWVRIHDAAAYVTKWYFLEDKPDHFDFTQADAGVKVFRDAKLMILGMLDTSPTWRSRNQKQDWFSKYHIPTPESMPQWAAYCRDVVTRYKSDIHDWEVWNEPYVNDFFRLRDTDSESGYVPGTPADYVKLLAPAYAAAKMADPNCNVLWSDAIGKWSQGCSENRAYEHCDQASYHNYTSTTPLSFLDFGQAMKEMRGNMPEQYQKMVFWNTEGGVGGTNDTHILSHTAKPGDLAGALEQAEFLVRYQIASQVYGAKRFFLYTFHYHGWNASWDLLLPDGSLPPHASAQSAMMWHLEGRKYVSTVPMGPAYSGYVFSGSGGDTIAVLAHNREGANLIIPKLPDGCVLRTFFGNDALTPQRLDRSVWYITTPPKEGETVAKSIAPAAAQQPDPKELP